MDIPKTLFATLVKQGRMEMHLTQEALVLCQDLVQVKMRFSSS